jgi:2-keto-4-pentenoate hydratase/2-oxohepta-3-ene-1,7-dioic acid hydratase in catechol pathway
MMNHRVDARREQNVSMHSGLTRYVRYQDGSEVSCGILEGDIIRQLDGYLFDNPQPTGASVPTGSVQLLVPLDPRRTTKVLGVAGNYLPEGQERTTPHPRWFAKLPSALNAHEGEVGLPPHATNFNFEGELVLIVGKQGRYIPVEEASSYIFGVTVGNDWSENTWYFERHGVDEPARLLAKSMDGWACLYTTIVTRLDLSDLEIEIRVNGDIVSRGRTSRLLSSPAGLIAYASQYVTLMPGDVIYTGTPTLLPEKTRIVKDGDVVEVEIPPIGVLRNRVVALPHGVFPPGAHARGNGR